MIRIIAIRVVDRVKESGLTQNILSKHSSVIKVRLGFHELNEDICSREGYILLHLKNDETGIKALLNDLDKIYGIELKQMDLGPQAEKPYPIPVESTIAVVGMIIKNRSDITGEIQKILTSYGCSIRTRLGINEDDQTKDSGLILLELVGEHSEMNRLVDRLNSINNVSVGVISFN
ncbi:MAG: hypothetical protein JW965_09505 [Bacteroidales bacterium]|nr:hypothetical protein [Bacteroidales bacterium]